MLYTELLQLWDESVQAVDAKDWVKALAKVEQISEPTSRTLFNAASAHLALGQLEPALKVCVLLQTSLCHLSFHYRPHRRGMLSFRLLGLKMNSLSLCNTCKFLLMKSELGPRVKMCFVFSFFKCAPDSNKIS